MTTEPDVEKMTMDALIEKYGTEGISLVLRFLSGDRSIRFNEIANDLSRALRSCLAEPDRDLHR